MESLMLICEGGAHTVEYFHKNRVFPSSILFTPARFADVASYVNKKVSEVDLLVVIKGFTDFSYADVYALMGDIEANRDSFNSVTIVSNIDLGSVDTPYYLYEGDLFYGSIKEIKNGKAFDVLDPDVIEEDKSKKKKVSKKVKIPELDEKSGETISINAVLARYKKYSKRDTKFMVYGSEPKELEPSHETDSIVEKVVAVDLFKTKGTEG